MAEILNLRRFRKARKRSEGEAAADRNRAAFGRNKGDRAAGKAADERTSRFLDAHLRDPPLPNDAETDGESG